MKKSGLKNQAVRYIIFLYHFIYLYIFYIYSSHLSRYPDEQRSDPVYLQEGDYYFMESFMKEGSGGDDLSIGIKLPNNELQMPITQNLYLVPGKSISLKTNTIVQKA